MNIIERNSSFIELKIKINLQRTLNYSIKPVIIVFSFYKQFKIKIKLRNIF